MCHGYGLQRSPRENLCLHWFCVILLENHQILGSNFESPTATSQFGRLAHRVGGHASTATAHTGEAQSCCTYGREESGQAGSIEGLFWFRYFFLPDIGFVEHFRDSKCVDGLKRLLTSNLQGARGVPTKSPPLTLWKIPAARTWFRFFCPSCCFYSWMLDPHETATDIASKKAAAVGAFSLTFGVCCLLVGRPRWMHCTKVSSRKWCAVRSMYDMICS